MALTKTGTDGIKDDAITLDKLAHGTSSQNGKFLRANNGAAPSFETVNTDLVADTSPQLGGDLATNSNDIVFADNDKAVFGSGSDLQIYHDGTDSYINDAGTGNLYLVSTDGNINLQTNGSENAVKCIENGAVEIYHDNSKKFESTSDGYYYYGTITGGSGARSNAGITQANVHTPAARFFTGGYQNTHSNVTIQATTGNWQNGLSSSTHRSTGLLFNRVNNNVQVIRAGIQHDFQDTEKFKFHTSYGDIHFRTRNDNNGNKTWEECDRDPLVMHHNGHVAMMHMPRALMTVGVDASGYSNDLTLHTVTGTVGVNNGITHSNGVFTVPYQGVYSIQANVGIHTNSSNTQRLDMLINGGNWQRTEHAGASGWQTQHISHVLELSANTTIEFKIAGRHDSSPFSRITICMLHGTLTT